MNINLFICKSKNLSIKNGAYTAVQQTDRNEESSDFNSFKTLFMHVSSFQSFSIFLHMWSVTGINDLNSIQIHSLKSFTNVAFEMCIKGKNSKK